MFNRNVLLSNAGRGVALAAVTAFVVTSFEVPKVQAAETHKPVSMTTSPGMSGATEFSARRRGYGRGYGGAAAALGAFGLVAGGIAAAAAANSGPDYYGSGYGYGGGYYDAPGYSYGSGQGYYGNGYYDNGYYGNGGNSGYSSTQGYKRRFGGN